MNIRRVLLFRALVLACLIVSCICWACGKERPSKIHIVRNASWNDLITQIRFLPDDVPQDSLDKEMFVIQRFLKAHETEARVDIYDLAVFKAIDRARARLQKADKDLETLRNELSYREEGAKLGR